MVIIPDYTLRYKPQLDAFLVIDIGPLPPCPICGGELRYRDSRPRIRRREGGVKEHLIIHRLRCEDCHAYHNELPDCLVPHKHYDAETISGVLDEVVKPSDTDSEDYPCLQTMLRWITWLNFNLANMEGCLRRASQDILRLGKELLLSSQSLLEAMRSSFPDWMEKAVRVVYNSGGALTALY